MISVRGVARAAVVGAMVLLAAGAVQAVVIDTVPVGNPGNAADNTGYGAVAYSFNMGKYEVTAGQYTAFLNAVGGLDTYALYNTNMSNTSSGSGITQSGGGTGGNPYTYSVATDFANRPLNYVGWGDAARFANWLTNGQPTGAQGLTTTENGSYYLNGATTDAGLLAVTRKTAAQGGRYYIPTEDEWYKAAYHKNDGVTANYFDYPTGSDSLPSNDLITLDPGNNANFWQDGDTIGSPYYRTVVGDFENSESPYGTFDQGGNVQEWNETMLYGDSRGLRGGSFEYSVNSPGCFMLAASRGNIFPTYESPYYGFRVSEVPEPATLALLALGGLALLRRRRK